MAKDLRLDVVTTSDGKGLLEAAAETEHLAKEVDKLGTQMHETAVDSEVAANRVNDLGDQMRRTTRDGGLLAIELEAIKTKQKELAAQYDYTGDKSLLKQISSTRRYSNQLKQLQKDMEDAGATVAKEAENVGADIGQEVEKGMAQAFSDSSAGPLSGPVLLGILASPGTYGIATMAGQMIGGAVLTGIGLVGIGSGIALELHSPQVQSSIERLKSDVSGGLKNAALSFVAPLSRAIDGIDAEFARLQPGIKSVFDEIAPEIDKLGAGASGFLDELVPAFGRAIVAAKPLLDMVAADLPGLGASLGSLFDTISANSGTATLGLQDIVYGLGALINLVKGGIVVFSALTGVLNAVELTLAEWARNTVAVMADVAHALHLPSKGYDEIRDELSAVVDKLHANGRMADGVTGSLGQLNTAAIAASTGVDKLATEVQNFNTQLSAMDGLLNRTEALNNLTIGMAQFAQQLKNTKDDFRANTEAGAQNQNAYIALVKQAEQYRQTLIASGVTQAQADKMFDDMVKKIDAAALAAGLSAKQIEALNKQLGIAATTKPIDIPINVHTSYTYSGQRPSLGHNIPIFGDGGHFDPGPIIVGDKGKPELLVPDFSGTIIPNPGSIGLGGRTSASVVAGPTVVRLEAVGPVAEVLLSLLRPHISGSYGGDLNAALAGNRN